MAILQKIIVSDFRNIQFAELQFSPGVNCICGDNGQGKTNILDAVHYLSMTKSAFSPSDRYCFRYGCSSFSIAGAYQMPDGLVSRFVVTSEADGGKTVKRDDKVYPRVSAHIGTLPVVIVSPQDSALVSESGEERRRFVNAVLSQMSPEYLAAVQRYNRCLQQRNRILKDYRPDVSLIEVIDAQMSESASVIVRHRAEFSRRLETAVSRHYSLLSGDSETVGIEYKTDLIDSQGVERPLDAILKESLQKDMIMKYTTAGPQRDDLLFTMNGHPLRKCGSQGQQKSFLVALKLAQYDIMKQAYGFPPILLLDDIFDKLDTSRISNLLKLVSDNDYGQIFLSDTNYERIRAIVSDIAPDASYFIAHNGEF